MLKSMLFQLRWNRSRAYYSSTVAVNSLDRLHELLISNLTAAVGTDVYLIIVSKNRRNVRVKSHFFHLPQI